MLVLSRRRGESIIIGTPAGPIKVLVVENHRGKVRIGVEAPRDIPVFREEIWDEIEEQRQTNTAGGILEG